MVIETKETNKGRRRKRRRKGKRERKKKRKENKRKAESNGCRNRQLFSVFTQS
jgi:hypothetical protein